jgi:diguanylate cyclase (GGDEF)-like protein
LEVLIIAALVATAGLIYCKDRLLSREIVFSAATPQKALGKYEFTDAAEGGTSSIAADPGRALSWTCRITDFIAEPYCGVGFILGDGAAKGVDLSRFKSFRLEMEVTGPGRFARLQLKNSNPAYSRPGNPVTYKYNYADVPLSRSRFDMDVPLAYFSVADWWKQRLNIPAELARPDFRNVVQFEMQFGLDGRAGVYRIRIDKVSFQRQIISDEKFYEVLAALWAALILAMLSYRRIEARRHDREEAARLRWASEHDSLTKLPNRAAFQCRLQAAILTAMEAGSSIALLLVDLDHFKHVNDSLGHSAGDELLRHVSGRLRLAVDGEAFVARIGGDEFAVILETGGETDILSIANRIAQSIKTPLRTSLRLVSSGASIGAAIFPRDAQCAGDLFNAADTALYALKHSGRGGTKIFDELILREMRRSASHLSIARAAASGRNVVPFYQPVVDLSSKEIVGFEALLRCAHAGRFQSADILVEAFADYEIATGLAGLMHRQVAADLSSWIGQGLKIGRIAINAAPAEFLRDDYAEKFLAVLAEHRLPARHLTVEVTEHVFLGRSSEYVARAIGVLKAAGVRISLDDFGTGYSSLSHLRDLRVDAVKMDKSFIDKISDGGDAAAIVLAVLSLARSLKIATIAEGVETEPQARLLRSMGCELAQGYFFGRPLEARAAADLMAMAIAA